MTTKHLNSSILRLAIPSILANITIPLVGLVDTAIVGHISNASAIGGIAIGTMLFDLLYWNFGFLRVGTSGMTAQAWGREDYVGAARLLSQSLIIAMMGALLIFVIQWAFVNIALSFIPCSVEAAIFARKYFYIRVWAAPATLALMALKGWFIGLQDTISPMITDIVVNVVNMVVSYLLAVQSSVGAIGVAYGTLIAQYTGFVLAILLIILRCPDRVFRALISVWKDFKSLLLGIRRLILLNTDLFVRSLCFMVVYVGFTALASRYGDEQLAVSSIFMKLFMLFSYFVDGFAYAGEALVGQAIGQAARDHAQHRLSMTVNRLILWSIIVGVIFSTIYYFWGDNCLGWITSDADVLRDAEPFKIWLISMPLLSTLAFIWDGIYAGATAGKDIRNAMILAAIGFVIGYYATYTMLGIQALYVAYFIHLTARFLYLSIRWGQIEKQFLIQNS